MKYLTFILVAAVVSACGVSGTPENSTKLRAKAEQEAGTEVQNKNNAEKAARMEADLKNWHNYYQAVAGTFEGEIATGSGSYKIRINLVPNVLPYSGKRVRELSEIENDINNLYFNVNIVQWNPRDEASAVPCSVSGVKPNIYTGYFDVKASENCFNTYRIYLSQPVDRSSDANSKDAPADDIAKSISNQLQNGVISRVNRLTGTIQSKAFVYTFDALRRE